jgi:hypothetical protein
VHQTWNRNGESQVSPTFKTKIFRNSM